MKKFCYAKNSPLTEESATRNGFLTCSFLNEVVCTMADKDEHSKRFLVYGASGWIGGHMIALLQECGHEVVAGTSRLENLQSIELEVKQALIDITD
jgi:NADPH:quinone reductase-like Zn-dependent oxidoreductase